MKPNKLIRLVLWLSGYGWRVIAIYPTQGYEEIVVIGKR